MYFETPPQLTRNTFGNHLRSASIGFFRYVYTHHVIGAYLQLPFLIFIPILLAFGNIGKSWMHILIWILILLVANAVIAIPGIPGNPAHRYTEYLVAPLSILVTYGYFTTSIVFEFPFYQLMSVSDSLLLLLTIYSLGAIVTNSIIDGKISPPADLSHAVDFLKEIDRQCHVYAIPGTYGKRVLPDTNHAQMQAIHDHFATRDGRRECFELFVSSDEKDRLEKAHNRYTVDYILGDIELIEDEIDGEFNPLFSSGDVGVYALESIMTED